MKKIYILFFGLLPLILAAQNTSTFLESVEIKISETELNTNNSDFGPAIVKDELWFSAYTSDEIESLSNKTKENVFYNLFRSEIDKNAYFTTQYSNIGKY